MAAVTWAPLTDAELRRYVVTQPEIVRARRTLVEVYRRLTDYPTPPCVVRQISPAVELLDAWIGSEGAHL